MAESVIDDPVPSGSHGTPNELPLLRPRAGRSGAALTRLREPLRGLASGRSVRARLTATYALLFLACGASLLTITYLLVDGASFAPSPGYNPPAVSGNGGLGAAAERHFVLNALLLRSGIALAIMAVISTWLGWLVAGRVLAPLREITARTREISEANLHQRLALDGPSDEITQLSDTIDALLSRLEQAFEAQRRFVANVSHELRTPLTMMRTSLDVAAGKPQPMSQDATKLAGKVREGLDHADRLVESFLLLARAEAGGADELEAISFSELAQAAVRERAAAIRSSSVSVDSRLAEVQVLGSRTLLARLVANLVDNAIRYGRHGGTIQVRTLVNGPMARLTVTNDGPVIDPADAASLIEPFRRAGADRTGSEDGVGMGLAIVAAIASAHHGSLQLHAQPHGGLTATVELPRLDGRTTGART